MSEAELCNPLADPMLPLFWLPCYRTSLLCKHVQPCGLDRLHYLSGRLEQRCRSRNMRLCGGLCPERLCRFVGVHSLLSRHLQSLWRPMHSYACRLIRPPSAATFSHAALAFSHTLRARTHSVLRWVVQSRHGIGLRHLPELQHERLQLVLVHVQRWLLAELLGRIPDMHR